MGRHWLRGLLPAISLVLLLAAVWPPQTALAQGAGQPNNDSTCLGCHAAQGGIMDGHHGAKANPRTPAGSGQGCTACHGFNPNHASNPSANPQPNRFGKGKAAEETAVCMSCHGGNRHLAFWESGRHNRNEVACSSCHKAHTPPTPGSAVSLSQRDPTVAPLQTTQRQLEYETCIQCHKTIRTQILKNSHHPIVEGKVTCSSCHNPHGALSHAMVKQETVNQQCTSCHAEKRGPFMFNHPAVDENCLSCHTPHGSTHNSLLTEKVPNLCQDCHDWSRHPGTAYGGDQGFVRLPGGATSPNTRFVARACLNCHTAIHGSNAPANRGRFFLR